MHCISTNSDLVKQDSLHFLNQLEVKTNRDSVVSVFSTRHLSFRIGMSFVIGEGYWFDFGSRTLNLKLLLQYLNTIAALALSVGAKMSTLWLV